MKLPKFNRYWLEIISILLLGLVPLLWYKSGYMALGHDMSFPLAPIDHFWDRLYVWTDRVGTFGSNQTDALNGIFIHGLEAILQSVVQSLVLSQQLSFIFWFTLPGITMYIFLRSLYPDKEDTAIRLIGSVFYMMNHYLLQAWVIAERTKFSLVAALPLVILIMINVLMRNKDILTNSIILSILLSVLNGGAGIPLWGGLVVATFPFLAVLLLLAGGTFWKKIHHLVSLLILTGIFFSLLNAYWLYPYVKAFQQNFIEKVAIAGGGDGAVGWSHEISKNASFSNLIRLQGIPDMYDNDEHPYAGIILTNPLFIGISILFPLILIINFLFISDYTGRSRTYLLGFVGIFLLSLPFVAGSHSPFGFLYDFLLRYLPGFSIFRTPFYKFGMALWFAYACLFALGINTLIKRYKLHTTAVLAVTIGILSVYNYPFFNGIFFDWSKKFSTMVKVPDYIFEAKKELDSNEFSTRTMLVPGLNPDTKYESYTWKYFSLSTIPSILSRRSVVINDATVRGLEANILNDMYDQLTKGNIELFKSTGTENIIIRNDFYKSDDEVASDQFQIEAIKRNPHFKYQKTMGKWDYYTVKDVPIIPLISSSNKIPYLTSEPNSIKSASELPAELTSDPFVHKYSRDQKDVTDILPFLSQFFIQTSCVNCVPERIFYTIKLVYPKILPGSKFYKIVKIFEELDKNKITDLSIKIDFILGNITKRISVFDSFITNERKNTKAIVDLLEEWKGSLEEIMTYYQQITDPVVKEQNAIKVYYYSRQMLTFAQKWIEMDKNFNGHYQSETKNFSEFIKDYISNPIFELVRNKQNISVRKYVAEIPKSGNYKILVKSQRPESSKILVSGKPLSLVRSSNSKEWLSSEEIPLQQGNNQIVFPDQSVDFSTLFSLPSFLIQTKGLEVSCRDIPLENVDEGNTYRINLNFEGISRNYFNLSVLEQGKYIGKPPTKREYIKNFFMEDKGTSSYDNTFGVTKGTQRMLLQLCVDPYSTDTSAIKINNFSVGLIPPVSEVFFVSEKETVDYNPIEFVALNQTKYLVGFTSPLDSTTILRFNSRFDKNWKIREINPELAKPFFSGNKRYYPEYRVTEYARQDRHLITDVYFPKIGKIDAQKLAINKITNIWSIENTKKKVFLLEYTVQNEFYKAALVSFVSLLGLLVILLLKKNHVKQ